jgi:hypothetical protein
MLKQIIQREKLRIRVINSKGEIFKLNPGERIVHMAFRPSSLDILGLVESCPKIEVIQLPKSYMSSISKSIECFLRMRRIQLIEGDVWGHRNDLNEYYNIPSSVIEKIKIMKLRGKSTEDIKREVSRKSKLNPKMIAYIMIKEALA